MRKLLVMLAAAGIAACGSGGSSSGTGALAPGLGAGGGGSSGSGECSVDGQKQTVLDVMNFWYLWNDRLPANVNIDDFATPESLLEYLTDFRPDGIPRFSFLTTAEADQAFFGEGRYEGFGFGYEYENGVARITRVFADSPAGTALPVPLARGQQILALNGETIADLGSAEAIDAALSAETVDFLMSSPTTGEFAALITRGIVTIDPVPQYRIIDNGGTPVGYIELETFISTADDQLVTAFNEFLGAGVQQVIIDLRYNGGGLVSTAELLGDLLGGSIAQGQVFSETRFNADRSDNNSSELFELRTNSLSLSNLVIIASRGTASASELVTNSMDPTSADVVIVGDRTFGKPVGQIGLEFCGQLIRPTAFQTLNGAGVGDYFDGLLADFEVEDDISTGIGADDDPNIIAALTYLSTGEWPAQQADGPAKANLRIERETTFPVGRSTAEVYTGAR